MLYSKKIVKNVFIQIAFFLSVLITVPIYASTLGDLINNSSGNENKFCTETNCFFPSKLLANDDVIIDNQINWNNDKNLVLHTRGSIIFKEEGKVVSKKNGSIILKSGMEPGNNTERTSTVVFEGKAPQIEFSGTGVAKIYYNPQKGNKKYKFHNPGYYGDNINPSDREISYMLINDVNELQQISRFLAGNYALSQTIDAIKTKNWAGGKGFMPMGGKRQDETPFTGDFDGNNYVISNLYINRPDENDVGIFAFTSGRALSSNVISNLHIHQAHITGDFRVGTVVSEGVKTNLVNIYVEDSTIVGYGPVGSLAGTLEDYCVENINQDGKTRLIVNDKQISQKPLLGAVLSYILCQSSDDSDK